MSIRVAGRRAGVTGGRDDAVERDCSDRVGLPECEGRLRGVSATGLG